MGALSIISGLISLAPTLVGWFAGDDAEKKAQKVCSVASAITGISDPKQAVTKVINTPGLQSDFQKAVIQMQHEYDMATLKDRTEARTMQMQTLKLGGRIAKNFIYIYASFITVFACCYMAAITFYPVPEKSIRFADTFEGFLLGTVISTIIGFFYGAAKKDHHG